MSEYGVHRGAVLVANGGSAVIGPRPSRPSGCGHWAPKRDASRDPIHRAGGGAPFRYAPDAGSRYHASLQDLSVGLSTPFFRPAGSRPCGDRRLRRASTIAWSQRLVTRVTSADQERNFRPRAASADHDRERERNEEDLLRTDLASPTTNPHVEDDGYL